MYHCCHEFDYLEFGIVLFSVPRSMTSVVTATRAGSMPASVYEQAVEWHKNGTRMATDSGLDWDQWGMALRHCQNRNGTLYVHFTYAMSTSVQVLCAVHMLMTPVMVFQPVQE